jgi:zinc transport system ATP-binding protein
VNESHSDGPVADFRDVEFAYTVQPVLRDVNLTIDAGDFVSVIGPNGAGKTTLARLLIGLLEPSKGDVRLFGGKPRANRHRVGYVPQYANFDYQFPILVREVVLMGRLGPLPRLMSRGDREFVDEALSRVGLTGKGSTSFNALSGGQRQRVLIARALAARPALLIMDEPTSSVDRAAEESLRNLLVELNREMTIMLITHDLGFVSREVNKILCVNVVARLHRSHEVTEDMIRGLFGYDTKYVEHHTHG